MEVADFALMCWARFIVYDFFLGILRNYRQTKTNVIMRSEENLKNYVELYILVWLCFMFFVKGEISLHNNETK